MHTNSSAVVIDVREIKPRDRHALIFQTFDNLQPGTHFILVNDHAPVPLHYQFMHERSELFTWEYLEEGPDVWQVQIGKKTT